MTTTTYHSIQLLPLLFVRHVTRTSGDVIALASKLRHGAVDVGLLATAEHNLGAFLRQALANGETDPVDTQSTTIQRLLTCTCT